ncbi:serine hydrolase domain-containing protein [Kocuria aegyptia]|uniref:serine hydrolase domain-containing protein n=1 Tax=Kocuria aegyptia TaxID=330943 RepID=UPI003CD09730
MDEAVAAMMRAGRVPGLSLAVIDHERLLYAGGFGVADLRDRVKATPRTVYLWFSMTKMVTATAVMGLVEAGRIGLDVPAADYVDFLAGPEPGHPTVDQLLTHTAGLSNPLPLRWVHAAQDEPPSAEDMLRSLTRRRRAYRYPAGGTARYSNVGYLALGQIIEAVTGTSMETYVRQAVLEPVGMAGTGFAYPPGVPAAVGYVRAPRVADPVLRRMLPRGVAGPRTGPFLGLRPFYVDGPAYGGLVGDVVDAARFLRMHLADGQIDGRRVLSADTTRAMRVVEHPGKPFHHGIGWSRPGPGAQEWVEHFGAGAGFWNVMRLYPDRDLGIVVMANSTTSYDFDPVFSLLARATWS